MSQTVLVADDSKTIRQIVGMALKASDYKLVEASSARSTLDALAQQRPDVVLLDYHMPDGSGYDVCRTIKSGAQTRHIAVVMLGGTYKNFDENRAKQSGADEIVMKPFKTDDLLNAIERALSSSAGASIAPLSLPTPGLAPPPNPFSMGTQGSSLPPVAPTPAPSPVRSQPAPSPMRSSQPAPSPMRSSQPAPAPMRSSQPAPSPMRSSQPAPVAHQAPAAPAGVDKAQMESMISDEVRRIVREELPGMLRSVLGNLVEQKLMPKIMQRSEQQVNQLMSTQLEQRVTSMVRVELEKLLSD